MVPRAIQGHDNGSRIVTTAGKENMKQLNVQLAVLLFECIATNLLKQAFDVRAAFCLLGQDVQQSR